MIKPAKDPKNPTHDIMTFVAKQEAPGLQSLHNPTERFSPEAELCRNCPAKRASSISKKPNG
jgi:hypothetical protein